MTNTELANYERAEDRTLHWTLSLYVRPEKLWETEIVGTSGTEPAIGCTFQSDCVAMMQLQEPASRALRDAIEPLFNDIADRESQGQASDFLLAVDVGPKQGDPGAFVRKHVDLVFDPPEKIGWRTEGRNFIASPKGLDDERPARMRRFWFVHNNGALSWHAAFTLRYRHDPADYLFLAMLQKLAAPKEFTLKEDLLEQFAKSEAEGGLSVLDDRALGIGPLDDLRVKLDGSESRRFWPLIGELFEADARNVLKRLAKAHKAELALQGSAELLDLTKVVEVPGLQMPRCRTMIFFHDQDFFKRLSPYYDADGNRIKRRTLVQDGCYQPYADRLNLEIERKVDPVELGDGDDESFWHFVRERPDEPWYTSASDAELDAVRNGTFDADQGDHLHIPTLERKRKDCLDFLFLSGFNQNIIDFMNQEPSEILDGTDPIYPKTEDQEGEGFFVRFANHRSMITYAPRSRSLEVGNDYIGTCPYAFLIHVMSLHNEYLARDFEKVSLDELQQIESQLNGSIGGDGYQAVARRINTLKISRYRNFEQHRHTNVFRYDTERDVFAELEQLRGVRRKETALDLALDSLEDHADDLENHRSSERDRNIGAIGFLLGGIGAAEGLNKLSEFIGKHAPANGWLAMTESVLSWLAFVLTLLVLVAAFSIAYDRRKAILQLLQSAGQSDERRDSGPSAKRSQSKRLR